MKYLLIVSVLLNIVLIGRKLFSQSYAVKAPATSDSLVSYSFNPEKMIAARVDLFSLTPANPGATIFLGNSLVEGFPLQEAFQNLNLKNRGIGGNTTKDILNRLPEIIHEKPGRVFLMAGINDLFKGYDPKETFSRFTKIVEQLQKAGIAVTIQSVLPVSDHAVIPKIEAYNQLLSQYCNQRKIAFVNLYPLFLKDGAMNPDLTFDGTHLTGRGYIIWRDAVKGLL